jgi:hypothetical protein
MSDEEQEYVLNCFEQVNQMVVGDGSKAATRR